MDKKLVKIIVSGTHNTGKTRIIDICMRALKENGFEIDLEPSNDYHNENEFEEIVSNGREEAIKAISERVKVHIAEVYTVSPINKNG